jgi:hypothetical protein
MAAHVLVSEWLQGVAFTRVRLVIVRTPIGGVPMPVRGPCNIPEILLFSHV